jgi:hypothetical protein
MFHISNRHSRSKGCIGTEDPPDCGWVHVTHTEAPNGPVLDMRRERWSALVAETQSTGVLDARKWFGDFANGFSTDAVAVLLQRVLAGEFSSAAQTA